MSRNSKREVKGGISNQAGRSRLTDILTDLCAQYLPMLLSEPESNAANIIGYIVGPYAN